jgi:hypothetical protein
MCENMAICVKNWLSLDICVNVWKYGHLCENFTFIGYFCKICSMCENMDVSEVCAVSWSLVFSFWWCVCFLAKQKGDTPIECASHILVKGDVRCGCAPAFYLIWTKKRKPYRLFSTRMLLAAARGVPVGTDTTNIFVPMVTLRPNARSTMWSTSYLKSSKQMAYRGFKS